jgi:bla regulator protein blaR1
MPMQVLCSRSFPRIAVCGLIVSGVFGGLAASSSRLGARAQTVGVEASESSELMPARQKAAGGKVEFEVASIRPGGTGAGWRGNLDMSVEDFMRPTGGRFSMTTTLGSYILFAYKLAQGATSQSQADFSRVPRSLIAEYFDVEAKAPMANPTKDQVRLMMQSLLSDRFRLAAHFETREMPVMALVLVKPGKLGPRLRPHSQGPSCDAKIPPVDLSSPKIPDVWIPFCGSTQNQDWNNNTVIMGSRDTTMDTFANWIPLLEPLDRPLVNLTGLTGTYDFEVVFTPPWKMPKMERSDTQLDLTGPTFLEGLKDDLGLTLISTHAPVQTLVIDHVEQPSPN